MNEEVLAVLLMPNTGSGFSEFNETDERKKQKEGLETRIRRLRDRITEDMKVVVLQEARKWSNILDRVIATVSASETELKMSLPISRRQSGNG